MDVRTFQQMKNILIKQGFKKLSNDTISGEKYDEWRKENFKKQVDCLNKDKI